MKKSFYLKFLSLGLTASLIFPFSTVANANENEVVVERENINDEEKSELIDDGTNIKYKENGEYVENAWINVNGNFYYFGKDQNAYKGWHYMSENENEKTPHWTYFGNDGILRTGWRYLDEKDGQKVPHWSYFGNDGWLRTGWQYLDEKDDQEEPHWSYFGDDGWLRMGWKYLDEKDGQEVPHWSYFGDDGWLRTGWKYLDKKDGQKIPHWSYFGNDGWLRTGWQYLDEKDNQEVPHWSYFGDDGWLRTGLVEFKETENEQSHLSYFGDDGHLRVNTIVSILENGETIEYEADDKGWLTKIEKPVITDLNGVIFNIVPIGNKAFSLNVSEISFDNNANIQIWSSKNDNNTKFRFEEVEENTYRIVALSSEKALMQDGDNIVQYQKNNDDRQRFVLENEVNNTYLFKNKGTNEYVKVSDLKDGGNVALANNKEDATHFALEKTDYSRFLQKGAFYISSVENTNNTLSFNNNPSNGVYGVLSQKVEELKNGDKLFRFNYVGDGYYEIETANTKYRSALDVPGAEFYNGAKIWQYGKNGTIAQKWRILNSGFKDFVLMSADNNFVLGLKDNGIVLSNNLANSENAFKIERGNGFIVRGDRKIYVNQNGDTPMVGVDISEWQGEVNWQAVKNDDIDFAIIRRADGYILSNGSMYIDKKFDRNLEEVKKLKIPFGIYLYSRAVNMEMANREADLLISSMKNTGSNPELGVFIDIEEGQYAYIPAFGNLYAPHARRNITDITKHIVSRIKNAGYTAGIYASENYFNNILYSNELEGVLWMARYFTGDRFDTNVLKNPERWNIWQYSESGRINTINGGVDLNTIINKYW